MAKQIYFVISCDEWKSYNSERLIWIGSSPQKTKRFIMDEIIEENMEYGNPENSPEEQAKQFFKDWDTTTRGYLNDNLRYGYFDCIYDNSEV